MDADRDVRTAVNGEVAETFLAAVAAGLPTGFWAQPAVVGVSGGADSVALLLGLRRLAADGAAARLIVAHAEHDVRPTTAARDREFVARLAEQLGVRCLVGRIAVRDRPLGDGEGLEGRARRARYDFLAEAAGDVGARHVVVAHTADDQAETILHRMLRGTGLTGLGGMPAARELRAGIALVRPLLDVPRSVGRRFLVAEGHGWCDDETNLDRRHARNFLRHEILPQCESGPYPAAAAALVRLGRQAAAVSGAVRSAAEQLLESHATRHAGGEVVVRTTVLGSLDRHLRAEIAVALWRREGWPQRDMTARHYAVLADALAATAPLAACFPGGVHVAAGAGEAVFRSRPPAAEA